MYIFQLLGIVALLLFLYLLYTRVIQQYFYHRFYEKQGVEILPGFKHGVGHISNIIRYGKAASKGQVRFLYHFMVQEAYGNEIKPVVRL